MSNFARENDAKEADINTSVLYASGAFKNVYKGMYTHGSRAGEECVCKVFQTGSVFKESYFQVDLAVTAKALEIISSFNNANIMCNKKIWLNKPNVWTCCEPNSRRTSEKVIIEPMIENFQKFNSNTGWIPNEMSPWIDVMQALSHFSYHVSNGHLLICDLQGGIFDDGFILTDPVIMSITREYGPTDLGLEGLSTFFANHICNPFCQSNWLVPDEKKVFFKVEKGSTMALARQNRPPLLHYPPHQTQFKVEDFRFKVPVKEEPF